MSEQLKNLPVGNGNFEKIHHIYLFLTIFLSVFLSFTDLNSTIFHICKYIFQQIVKSLLYF